MPCSNRALGLHNVMFSVLHNSATVVLDYKSYIINVRLLYHLINIYNIYNIYVYIIYTRIRAGSLTLAYTYARSHTHIFDIYLVACLLIHPFISISYIVTFELLINGSRRGVGVCFHILVIIVRVIQL